MSDETRDPPTSKVRHLAAAKRRGPYVLQPGVIPSDQLPKAISWMNAQHAVVFDGSRTLVWTEQHNFALDRREWRQSSPNDFKTFYAPYIVEVRNGKQTYEIGLGQYWLRHPESRRYRDVVFDPTMKAPSTVLNLWRGFAVEPKQGNWDRLKDHIYEIVAGGNLDYYNYLIGWLATMVQQPVDLAGTAIVLRGDEGAGKGLLARSVGRLFGDHYVHIQHAGQLTNKFNGVLANALFVFADEAVWSGDRSGHGALRALITEPTLAIERKGKEIVTMRNCVHLMIASNNEWSAPVGPKDRRYFALDVGQKRAHEYYTPIYHEQANGGAGAMLFDLLHYDLSLFSARTIPHTLAKEDQILHTLQPVAKWWHDCLTTGRLNNTPWQTRVERGELYRDCLRTLQEWRVQYMPSQAQLGKSLNMFLPDLQTIKSSWDQRFYVIPQLPVARVAFEQFCGCPLSWPVTNDLLTTQ